MTTDVLSNARAMRDLLAKQKNDALQAADELSRKLARVDQFIADYESIAENVIPSAEQISVSISATAIATAKEALTAIRKRRNSRKEDVADAARRLILQRGAAIPRPELYQLLVKEGMVIEGSDPETVLSTMLWRTKDQPGVVHIRNHGYWPTEQSYAPASYTPDFDDIIGAADDEPPIAPPDYHDGDDA